VIQGPASSTFNSIELFRTAVRRKVVRETDPKMVLGFWGGSLVLVGGLLYHFIIEGAGEWKSINAIAAMVVGGMWALIGGISLLKNKNGWKSGRLVMQKECDRIDFLIQESGHPQSLDGPVDWTYFLSYHHPRGTDSFLAEYVAINNATRKGLYFYRRLPDHLKADVPPGHLWHPGYSSGRVYSANEGTAFHSAVPVYMLEDMEALRAILEKEVGPDTNPIQ
jgi:hypothetical protein